MEIEDVRQRVEQEQEKQKRYRKEKELQEIKEKKTKMKEYWKKFNNREEEIRKEDRGIAIREQTDRESEKNI